MVYNLYGIEICCRDDSDEWGVFSKRTMIVFALTEDHAMDLCREELLEGMPTSRQEFTIHMIHVPDLHSLPALVGTQ